MWVTLLNKVSDIKAYGNAFFPDTCNKGEKGLTQITKGVNSKGWLGREDCQKDGEK